MIQLEMIRVCTCERCGKKFIPRVEMPKQCPYCHSLLLHVPRGVKKGEKEGSHET